MKPMVSVIMPAYNAERFISIAVESVLHQTLTDWELLIMDDCSTDGTPELIAALAMTDPRIKVHYNPRNMGVAKTRNHALSLSQGQYIAFLDSDDYWHPTKLENQIALMQKTGAGLCYTSYALVDETGAPVRNDYLVPETVSFRQLLKENVIGCSTVVLSAELMEQRRFDPDYYHEDYVLWLHLLRDGIIAAGCPQVLTDWRYQDNSRSFNKWNSLHKRWDIYRHNLRLPIINSLYFLMYYVVAGLIKYRKR